MTVKDLAQQVLHVLDLQTAYFRTCHKIVHPPAPGLFDAPVEVPT